MSDTSNCGTSPKTFSEAQKAPGSVGALSKHGQAQRLPLTLSQDIRAANLIRNDVAFDSLLMAPERQKVIGKTQKRSYWTMVGLRVETARLLAT
jgi:hypothetical protein